MSECVAMERKTQCFVDSATVTAAATALLRMAQRENGEITSRDFQAFIKAMDVLVSYVPTIYKRIDPTPEEWNVSA